MTDSIKIVVRDVIAEFHKQSDGTVKIIIEDGDWDQLKFIVLQPELVEQLSKWLNKELG